MTDQLTALVERWRQSKFQRDHDRADELAAVLAAKEHTYKAKHSDNVTCRTCGAARPVPTEEK